jgi:hypothetical protein
VRKQYCFRPSDRGLLAWDVDRLVQLSSQSPRKHVLLSDIRELDEGSVRAEERPTWRALVSHLRFDDLLRVRPGTARLVAIATEWRNQAGVLLGTRVGIVLEAIRAQYQELDDLIPRARSVDITITHGGAGDSKGRRLSGTALAAHLARIRSETLGRHGGLIGSFGPYTSA